MIFRCVVLVPTQLLAQDDVEFPSLFSRRGVVDIDLAVVFLSMFVLRVQCAFDRPRNRSSNTKEHETRNAGLERKKARRLRKTYDATRTAGYPHSVCPIIKDKRTSGRKEFEFART